MANARSSKRDLEKSRLERAAQKRDRRQGRVDAPLSDEPQADVPAHQRDMPQEKVIAALSALHARFDNGDMSFDQFEADKAALIGLLHVD